MHPPLRPTLRRFPTAAILPPLLFLSLVTNPISPATAQVKTTDVPRLPAATAEKINRLLDDERWASAHVGVAIKQLGQAAGPAGFAATGPDTGGTPAARTDDRDQCGPIPATTTGTGSKHRTPTGGPARHQRRAARGGDHQRG